jgi:hypothetical protein
MFYRGLIGVNSFNRGLVGGWVTDIILNKVLG